MKIPANFVVLDFETASLRPEDGCPLEVGVVKANGACFHARIEYSGEVFNLKALEVNGIIEDELYDGTCCEIVDERLFEFLPQGKSYLVGRNPNFDKGFLDKYFPKSRERFHRRTIDLHSAVMMGAAWLLQKKEGYRFSKVSEKIDELYESVLSAAPEPKPHNALRGAIHEWECLRRLACDGPRIYWQRMELHFEEMGPDFGRYVESPDVTIRSADWLVEKLSSYTLSNAV